MKRLFVLITDFAFLDSTHSMYIRPNKGVEGEGFDLPFQAWGPMAFGHAYGQYYIGDYEGDGRSDFAFFEPADKSMRIRLNKEAGSSTFRAWDVSQFGNKKVQFLVGDFNGDKISDFALLVPLTDSDDPKTAVRIHLRLSVPEDQLIYPGVSLPDFDKDGDVELKDLEVLLLGYGKEANQPYDPRDLDGDGIITLEEARILVQMCTKPWCGLEFPRET